MTEEEMKARMRELSYLKIPPREQEKNKVLLLRGERLYEETTGELREQLEMVTQQFERILDRQDPLKIEEARKDYEEALDWNRRGNVDIGIENDLLTKGGFL